MAASWLRSRMKGYKGLPALIWQERMFTYRSLLQLVDGWHLTLDREASNAAGVVALDGDFSPRACALLLALIERASVAVPLASANAEEKEEFIRISQAQTIVSFREGDRWEIRERQAEVTSPLTCELLRKNEPGLVLFSSGSTGKSKAALHGFSKLLEKFERKRHRKRTISFLLLSHIGGINTLFYTFSNGGTLVTVEKRDPDVVCRAIERHRVQLLPTSPTFLNLLLISGAYMHHDLSSLELVTYGTEVMPEATLSRLREALPHVRLLQTYGLSELGILRSKSRDSGSLWVKIGGEGFQTKVVDGTLWIKARSAMIGYLNAPSPFDSEGWFNTHDAVEVDGEHIRILGRKSDIVNVGGQKVYPAEVENVLLQLPNVRDAVVSGGKNPILGEIVIARINLAEPESPVRLRTRVRKFCRARLAPYKVPLKIEITGQQQFTSRYKKTRPKSAHG